MQLQSVYYIVISLTLIEKYYFFSFVIRILTLKILCCRNQIIFQQRR